MTRTAPGRSGRRSIFVRFGENERLAKQAALSLRPDRGSEIWVPTNLVKRFKASKPHQSTNNSMPGSSSFIFDSSFRRITCPDGNSSFQSETLLPILIRHKDKMLTHQCASLLL